MRLRLVALLLPALLVAGCGSEVKQGVATATPTPTGGIPWPSVTATATPAADAPTPSTTATAAPLPGGSPSVTASATPLPSAGSEALGRNPVLLVGWWRIATSAGEVDLGLGDDAVVVQSCGESSISWGASPTGLLVAAGRGADRGCYAEHPDLSWLESGWAFAVSKERLLLTDDSGTVVARGVREEPPGGREAFVVTPALRARLADAKQLPVGVRPVTSKQLQRRWLPKGKYDGNGKAFVSYGADRTWTASDGCNASSGRFSLGDLGEVLATSGISTAVGCNNSPAPQWVARARRLGLVKGVLALYDGNAQLLGRLYPA